MIKKDRPLVAMVTSLAMGSFLSICALVACTTIMFEEDSHWRAVLLFLPLSLVSACSQLPLGAKERPQNTVNGTITILRFTESGASTRLSIRSE